MPRTLAPILLALAVCAPLAAQDAAPAPAGTPTAPAAEVPAAERAITAEAIVGKWRCVDVKGPGMPPEVVETMRQVPITLTFLADGSMLMDQAGETRKGFWRVENGRIFGRGDGPEEKEDPVDAKLVGDRLELTPPMGGMVMVLAHAD